MDTQKKYETYVNLSMVGGKLQPVVIDRARGSTYTDENGKEYIDMFAGISVANAGHNNPEVVNAAMNQMQKLVHCCSYVYYNKPVADLAEKISQIVPQAGPVNKSFFGNSGAEAIEGGMRLAKHYTKRNEFVALTHSFHGRTYATLSITGNAGRKHHGGPYMPGVAFAPSPDCYRCPFGKKPQSCSMECADGVAAAIKDQTSDNVAAFIAEPVQGEGGIIVPPAGYFQRVKQILDAKKILFFADEVQSGFCRTGKLFAIEHWGVKPDIISMAKGIASGFPISAFTAPQPIADAFTPGSHLSTFGGSPVSAAAALANIRYMERVKLADQAARKGKFAMAALRRLMRKHKGIGDVRGLGLMIGIELVKNPKTKEPDSARTAALRKYCLENGVLIGAGGSYGNVIRMQPPLTVSQDEIARTVQIIDRGLKAVK